MREAAEQLSRVLGQIATLPGTAALRGEQIKLKVALANALAHLKGYAAPETRTSLDRARWLIERAEAPAVETNEQPKDGRTSGYDAEIAEAICEHVVSGESLWAICADPAMPARATVFRWLASNQEFRQLSWTGTEVVYSN